MNAKHQKASQQSINTTEITEITQHNTALTLMYIHWIKSGGVMQLEKVLATLHELNFLLTENESDFISWFQLLNRIHFIILSLQISFTRAPHFTFYIWNVFDLCFKSVHSFVRSFFCKKFQLLDNNSKVTAKRK